jgi:hypothetical protein
MFGPFSSSTIAIESLFLCFKSFSVFFYKLFQKISKAQLPTFRERSIIGRERTSLFVNTFQARLFTGYYRHSACQANY